MDQRRTFRIIETLGKGGFGTVYRAEMTDAGGFSKQVALKIMHYRGEAAVDIARRMRDEARVLGLIRHRAIVGVNGLVPLAEGWGVVMDYIDGVDLSVAVHAGGPPPVAVTLGVVEEIAAALDAAYTHPSGKAGVPLRLVHRDIKPANIRVTATGEVKLLDFGVARAEFSSREAQDNAELVMGSVRYMAPERRQGLDAHKSDIYALGIVLANMLTARRFAEPPEEREPHDAFVGTVLETVQRAFDTAGDPRVQEAGRHLRLLLLEMLAFHPDDRPDGRTVALRLRRFRTSMPHPWLRDWAETNVPRLAGAQARKIVHDDVTGRVLREAAVQGAVISYDTVQPLDADESSSLLPAPTREDDPSVSSITQARSTPEGAAWAVTPGRALAFAMLFMALGAAVTLVVQALS